MLLMLGAEGTFLLTRVVTEWWSGDSKPSHTNYWIMVWGLVGLGRSIVTSMRWFWLYGNEQGGFTLRAAARMHDQMVARLLRAPLRFFDKTPIGRILNRFSGDTERVDASLPDAFGRSVMQVLSFLTSVLVLGITVPPILLVTIVMIYPFNLMRSFFGQLRASLARLEAVLASPLSGLTYEVIGSIVTVRGFGSSRFLSQIFATFEDVANRQTFATWAVSMAFSNGMLTLSSVILGATGYFLLLSDMTAAQAGFILSFGLDASLQLFWLLEQLVTFEEQMVAVERVAEITQITPEDVGEQDLQISEDWPRSGSVVAKDVYVQYAPDLPTVLHGVSFNIKSGERVCIVGRTGGGKSTTALSLLRDVAVSSGSIAIDGTDISRVPLSVLRSKLSFIPQESLLTSGTLRDALDITGEKDDHEIYAAIEKVHLDTSPGSAFADLDSPVSSGGLNFSLGERQLLVLARAILKQSKIIIMDEATSSVDYETDAKITTTIKESFKGTTLITIAHRLRTIIDYDRVLVLKDGKIVENGTWRQGV